MGQALFGLNPGDKPLPKIPFMLYVYHFSSSAAACREQGVRD